jgi:hypothetical protein
MSPSVNHPHSPVCWRRKEVEYDVMNISSIGLNRKTKIMKARKTEGIPNLHPRKLLRPPETNSTAADLCNLT